MLGSQSANALLYFLPKCLDNSVHRKMIMLDRNHYRRQGVIIILLEQRKF